MTERDARSELGSDDVRAVARWSLDLLEPLSDADWTAPAGGLDWSCRQTLEHLVFALDRYSLQLATPVPEPAPRAAGEHPHLSNRELLAMLVRRAGVLAAVVAASSPTIRAFHPVGSADPPGFVAIAIVETVIHTDDIARGLGQTSAPPMDLCRRALARLFPWAPADVDPWSALRWATGRIDVPGRPHAPSNWAWHSAPLSEWDGTVNTLP
jgi:uncharacterized protein (TIGR03083 family)